MSLTKNTTAINNIQTLADITKDQATAVKILHDKAGKEIKDYINDVLTVEIESQFTSKAEITNTRKLSATGDFTGTLNGLEIIAAEPGLSATVEAHLAEMAAVVKIFIAEGIDDTDDLQTLVDSMSISGGGAIYVKNMAVLKCKYQKLFEGGTINYAVEMKDNVNIIAADKNSGIKLADNESTDANPKNLTIFYSNTPKKNVGFLDLEWDFNEANNKISPNRGSGIYNRFLMSAVLFSTGTGRCDDLIIRGCYFHDHPGTTVIGIGQSNSVGTTLGKRSTIQDNIFYNCGTDTDDHSTIYGWGEDCKAIHNDFVLPEIRTFGWTVAHEIHGPGAEFARNKVKKYFQGVWVASNYTLDTIGISIHHNLFTEIVGCPIDFFRMAAIEKIIDDVDISHNFFHLTGDVIVEEIKTCVKIAAYYGITNVSIHHNSGKIDDYTKLSAFFSCTCNVEGEIHDDIFVENNRLKNFTYGGYLSASAGELGNVVYNGNKIKNLNNTAGISIGLALYTAPGKKFARIEAVGNDFIDNRGVGSKSNCGMRTECTVDELVVSDNNYSGMINGDYVETSLTVTRKKGEYFNISYNPAWTAGGAITIGDGAASASYTKQKNIITVNAKLTVGATTTFPGGNLGFALPFASITSGNLYLGKWRIFDSSVGKFYFGDAGIDGTGSSVSLQINDGTFITNGSPVALAVGDIIHVQISYTTAVA